MKLQPFILSLALFVPMTLVGQAMPNNNQSSNNQNNNISATTSNGNSSSKLAQSDQQFLKKLCREDQSEIKMANLALQKSSNPQIKQYAKTKILAADQNMKQQAQKIAQQDNVNLPNQVNAKEQNEYQKLSNLSGTQFDHEYLKYEARKQGKDLNMVQHEINNTSNQQLKHYAQTEETPVRNASQSAQQIASSMGVATSASAKY